MTTTIERGPLSQTRIAIALAVALAADALPFILGPLGWTFADEVIDVLAMGVLSLTLGFHVLFLPTFVVELVPVADMLPTWTACVMAVVGLRRRATSSVVR